MQTYVKDSEGHMVLVETAAEKEAKAEKEKQELLQQLVPLAEALWNNPQDYDARNKMWGIFSEKLAALIDAEHLDGSGDATNFTYLPNLVIKTIGSSGNFKIICGS